MKGTLRPMIGQWGTNYDETKDIARVPLQTRLLPVPVEKFTMMIETAGAQSTLRLLRDTTDAWVPIEVK